MCALCACKDNATTWLLSEQGACMGLGLGEVAVHFDCWFVDLRGIAPDQLWHSKWVPSEAAGTRLWPVLHLLILLLAVCPNARTHTHAHRHARGRGARGVRAQQSGLAKAMASRAR